MVGILNTFGFKPDVLPSVIYSNSALQITQVGGIQTLYTVPAGKTLYIIGNQYYNASLEPIASQLNFTCNGVITGNNAVSVTAGVGTQIAITDRNEGFTILTAGQTIQVQNVLALGDCTINLQITGYLL